MHPSFSASQPSVARRQSPSLGGKSPEPSLPVAPLPRRLNPNPSQAPSRPQDPRDPGVRRHWGAGRVKEALALGNGALSQERTEMPAPRSQGSCSARPNRKESPGRCGDSPDRRAFQAAWGLPRWATGELARGGLTGRGTSPCVRARPPGPVAATAATARRPPPRLERQAAASSSAPHRPGAGPPTPPPPPPPPLRPIRIHGAQTDARGPGPAAASSAAAVAVTVTARSWASPRPARLLSLFLWLSHVIRPPRHAPEVPCDAGPPPPSGRVRALQPPPARQLLAGSWEPQSDRPGEHSGRRRAAWAPAQWPGLDRKAEAASGPRPGV